MKIYNVCNIELIGYFCCLDISENSIDACVLVTINWCDVVLFHWSRAVACGFAWRKSHRYMLHVVNAMWVWWTCAYFKSCLCI